MVFNDVSTLDGTSNDQWIGSMAMYSYLVLLVNIRVGLDVRSWTAISVIFSILSVLAWFVFAAIYNTLKVTPNIFGVATRLFGMPIFWAGFIGLPIACLIPEISYRYIQRTYFPTPLDIVGEVDHLEELHNSVAAGPAGVPGALHGGAMVAGGTTATAAGGLSTGGSTTNNKTLAAGAIVEPASPVVTSHAPLLPPTQQLSYENSPVVALPPGATPASPSPAQDHKIHG